MLRSKLAAPAAPAVESVLVPVACFNECIDPGLFLIQRQIPAGKLFFQVMPGRFIADQAGPGSRPGFENSMAEIFPLTRKNKKMTGFQCFIYFHVWKRAMILNGNMRR